MESIGVPQRDSLIKRAQIDSNRRWWFIAGILALVIFFNQNKDVFEYRPVIFIIGLALVYNFFLAIFAYHKQVNQYWSYAETFLDLLLISAIIHFTDGIFSSPFFFLFPVLIIVQAMQLKRTVIVFTGIGILTFCIGLGLMEFGKDIKWGAALDRSLTIIALDILAILLVEMLHRHRLQTTAQQDGHLAEIEKIHLANEKLQLKIHSSTQKLEDANMMLVKKNLAMMAFHEIYVAMNSTFNSGKLLNLVLDTAMSLLKADSGCLMGLDLKTKMLRSRVSRGLENHLTNQLQIKLGQGIEGVVAKTGKEQCVNDLSGQAQGAVLNQDSMSKMCVPLINKSKVVGVITVESAKPHAFSKSDLELFATLGGQASEVLQNLELYEETKNKAERLSLLFEVNKDISTIFNLRRLFSVVLERSMLVMKARHGSLLIYDQDQDQLVIRAAIGLANTAVQKEVKVDRGIAGWVFRNVKPVLIHSVERNPLYDQANDKIYAGKDMIACPLNIRNKVFGVICLNDRVGEKPFAQDDLKLLGALASQAAIAIENVELYASIRRDYLNAIKALAAAVDAKDHYTHGHSNKVMVYAAMIARELGLNEKEIEKIKYSALLHDIGKIGISESVLNKPSKLTPKEFDTIAMHPILGVSIVQNIDSLKDLIPIILYHHERYAGGGYPEGKAGNSIPLGARIVAVADSWDVMTSDRAYRKALPIDVAVAELKKCAGTQFDPEAVNALLSALEKREKTESFKIEEDKPNLVWDEEEISRLMD